MTKTYWTWQHRVTGARIVWGVPWAVQVLKTEIEPLVHENEPRHQEPCNEFV